MLSVAALGVTCELHDRSTSSQIVHDHFTLTSQEAEAVGHESPSKHDFARWSDGGPLFAYSSRPSKIGWFRKRGETYRKRRRTDISLSFVEFAELSDGRRVTIRNDRSFGWSLKRKADAWYGTTRESLAGQVSGSLRQYEEDRPTAPEWVSERLRRLYGIDVDLASVEAALRAPRRVELGPRLLEALPE